MATTQSYECCTSGHLHQGTPKGSFEQVNGIRTYVSKGSPVDSARRALLHATDIYGLDLINAQLVADTYAHDARVDVFVPDFLKGDAVETSKMSNPDSGFSLPEWMKGHGRKDLEKDSLDFCKFLRSQGYQKIAVIGFCWGAPACYALSRERMVDAAAVAHPSLTEMPGDIENISTPFLFLCAEKDQRFSVEMAREAQEICKKKTQLDIQFEFYAGVVHGFAMRGSPDDEVRKKELMLQRISTDNAQ